MYTLNAIVLSKQLIRDNQVRVILFTEDYGKITAWTKKPYSISDIGSLTEIVIERKKQENIIHSITPLHTPKNEGWNYKTTLEYLTLFQLIRESLPEGMSQKDIFHDIKEIISHLSSIDLYFQSSTNKTLQLFILSKARILKRQGFLREELFLNSKVLSNIFQRLDVASMKSMINSREIHLPTLKEIEYAISEGIHTYKNRI
ncbi:MAG: hypothetical protein HHAS10_06760 [Candidatus Altimarinota bacterium]